MFKFFKADCYRICKERLGLVTLILLLALSGAAGYAFRDLPVEAVSKTLVSFLSAFLPLYFVTPGKIFFGEDLAQRTINNSLVKTQSRQVTFWYRWVMSVGTSLGLVILAYTFSSFVYQVFSGGTIYSQLLTTAFYQLPYYLFAAALPLVFFNFFDKIYMTNTFYIIYVLMFESLANLLLGNLLRLDADVYTPYLFIKKLSETVSSTGDFLNLSSISALIVSMALAGLANILFLRREFK
ncbi:hypothetical protein [Streptococcus plurextorum]|uniref:hypothetical protein n=1 Tax=Streptococcus plurextorum TaxID=456876 RepID=UPI00040E0722|nr:hypothetical protein [Streptococcus plurextorum]